MSKLTYYYCGRARRGNKSCDFLNVGALGRFLKVVIGRTVIDASLVDLPEVDKTLRSFTHLQIVSSSEFDLEPKARDANRMDQCGKRTVRVGNMQRPVTWVRATSWKP